MTQIKKYCSVHAGCFEQIEKVNKSDYALVIPCFSEDISFFDNVELLLNHTQEKVCVVVVINAPDNAAPEDVKKNQILLSFFKERLTLSFQANNYSVHEFDHHQVCVVDKTTIPLPHKSGVGLARKIGCDFAMQLFALEKIKTQAIFVSDADVVFPGDYFSRVVPQNADAAWIFPFKHTRDSNPLLAKGIADYETFLQSYVDGLKRAGSPYAFHTIGSTMVIHPEAYAKVRGFPKRAAAEDFYMLNKLAKVGSITQLTGAPLVLQGRLSHRVPFGTGHAMNKVLDGKEYNSYKASAFDYLSVWLRVVSDIQLDTTQAQLLSSLRNCCEEMDLDPAALIQQLEEMKAFELFSQAKSQVKDAGGLQRYINTWFDGFKTMKFIRVFNA